MHLTEETKKSISKTIGIPYEELIKMDDEEIEKYIEQKTGKKISWPEGSTFDGYPIKTMEEVNAEIDEMLVRDKQTAHRQKDDDWER